MLQRKNIVWSQLLHISNLFQHGVFPVFGNVVDNPLFVCE